MVDNDREKAANQADDNEDNDEKDEKRPPIKKTPESQSAPAPGDDIIIK